MSQYLKSIFDKTIFESECENSMPKKLIENDITPLIFAKRLILINRTIHQFDTTK